MSTADEVKRCCAAAYSSDVVALLLGEHYHPGGSALTRRLADRLGLRPGLRVLDVACGRGGTPLLLARKYGVRVDGIDLSTDNVAKAADIAANAGLGDKVAFHAGDAETLPYGDATFDALICECAFCTFTDKPLAAQEFARVLRPGGLAGITDITVDGPLPPELDDLAGWVACLADARTARDYERILADAGLTTTVAEDHDEALTEMIEQIQARLRLLRMAGDGRIDVRRGLELAQAASTAAADGLAGYCLLVATRHT